MQFRRPSRAVILIAGILAAASAGSVLAHKGAKGIVGERMMTMKHMGEGMKTMAAMVTGKAPFAAGKVEGIAAKLKQHAAEIPGQFPKGSLQKPTEALPATRQRR